MAVSLDEENRVSIPPSTLGEIGGLYPDEKRHVKTELQKIVGANYSPDKLVYKQYGDLKVFRCGDVIRLYGLIIEDIECISEFDNLVILLEVSKHDYEQAGVNVYQARNLQSTFSDIDSEEEFRQELDGAILDEDQIDSL